MGIRGHGPDTTTATDSVWVPVVDADTVAAAVIATSCAAIVVACGVVPKPADILFYVQPHPVRT